MTRWAAMAVVVFWAGATLLLSELRWFRRPRLSDRLAPFAPGGPAAARLDDPERLTDLLAPVARRWGASLSRSLGVAEDISTKLERIHSPVDASEFRLRQMAWTGAGLGAGLLLTTAARPPLVVALLFTAGGALLGFLVVEQQLISASDRWKERLLLELPVVSEQLGMLLGAGYSLGAALNRIAERGSGTCATDLQRVCGRLRQGLSDTEALREWAELADVEALTRLVGILAMNRQAGDLGRLIAEEARSIRRDVHRRLVEQIERRSQQVWIPVTVATLVPGAVLLAVPFIEALRLFSSS